MRDKELEELQDDGNWDQGPGTVQPPVMNARAVVSVAFSRRDLDRVSLRAEELGMKTSEFIRQAALERTENRREFATLILELD